jgi:hypothetical protein
MSSSSIHDTLSFISRSSGPSPVCDLTPDALLNSGLLASLIFLLEPIRHASDPWLLLGTAEDCRHWLALRTIVGPFLVSGTC